MNLEIQQKCEDKDPFRNGYLLYEKWAPKVLKRLLKREGGEASPEAC